MAASLAGLSPLAGGERAARPGSAGDPGARREATASLSTGSLDVLTFGCRLNALESGAMRVAAAEAGLADAILVNTCAVTAEAVRQARQAIRRAHRVSPGRPIVVAGCAAQIDPAAFAALPGVTRVLGNAEKLDAAAYDLATGAATQVADIGKAREAAQRGALSLADHTRAFLEIQNGCDHACTFCIIPAGRGASRSVALPVLVEAVRDLVARGHREVVLTGVDITAWGADLPGRPMLGTLVRAILRAVPELPRLRLSSLDAVEIDADLIAAFAEEERLMPHLHLSLQHGDDLALKRMKRRHSRADAIRLAETVRRVRPDVALGADLIAGFPTEDEAMFANALSLVDACGLTHLHVFPYSPRPGTPAARMPQVDGAVIRERAERLRAKGAAALAARLAGEIGLTRQLLVERGGIAHTEHFARARIAGHAAGEIVRARITGAADGTLIAEAA